MLFYDFLTIWEVSKNVLSCGSSEINSFPRNSLRMCRIWSAMNSSIFLNHMVRVHSWFTSYSVLSRVLIQVLLCQEQIRYWSFCNWPLPHLTLHGRGNKAKPQNWTTKLEKNSNNPNMKQIFKMLICFNKIIFPSSLCFSYFFHSDIQLWHLERDLDQNHHLSTFWLHLLCQDYTKKHRLPINFSKNKTEFVILHWKAEF